MAEIMPVENDQAWKTHSKSVAWKIRHTVPIFRHTFPFSADQPGSIIGCTVVCPDMSSQKNMIYYIVFSSVYCLSPSPHCPWKVWVSLKGSQQHLVIISFKTYTTVDGLASDQIWNICINKSTKNKLNLHTLGLKKTPSISWIVEQLTALLETYWLTLNTGFVEGLVEGINMFLISPWVPTHFID